MKNIKSKAFFYIIGLIVIHILLSACSDLFIEKEDIINSNEQDKVTVSFSVMDNVGRSVLPQVSLENVSSYKLFGGKTGQTESLMLEFSKDQTTVSLVLMPGIWNFTLNAYNSNDEHILQSKVINKQINLNEKNNVSFSLVVINNGVGNIQITIHFPQEAGITRISTSGGLGTDNFNSISNNSIVYSKNNITSGDYFVNFELFQGNISRTIVSELVLVRHNLTSSKTITLIGEDLKPLLNGSVDIIGTILVGEKLSVNTSSLNGVGDISYQWKRNGINIPNATDTSYIITSADVDSTITVDVTRMGYIGTITSTQTLAVPGIINATLNSVTGDGSSTQTTTVLTLTFNEIINDLTSNEIIIETNNVSGTIIKGVPTASGSTYTLPISGFSSSGLLTVSVLKTGYNISGSHSVPINSYSLPLTGNVGINGTLQTGQTLTADTSNLNGTGTLSYEWKRGTTIVGTNSSTYTVTADDVGNTNFTLTVSRTNYSGNVISKPMLTGTVGITGTLKTGQTLTGSFTHSCTGTISYQWRRGSTVVGSNSNNYTIVAADVGVFNFNLRVTCSNHSGWVENMRHRVLSVTENSGYNYNDGILTITDNGTYNIKMNESVNLITSDRIVVNSGITANITLSNVSINLNNTGFAAFDMTGATVNLTLVGDNVLNSGASRAGLQSPSGSTLSINGTGSLIATGGNSGAGIGGGSSSASGNISILSGTIIAKGGSSGTSAGIGGGDSSGSEEIKISGGTITANGSMYGPGIGTSSSTLRGNIIISGGVITANSGSQVNFAINGDSINITNSTVTATSRGYIHDSLVSSNIAIYCNAINVLNSTLTTNAISCNNIDTIGDNTVIFTSSYLSNISNLNSAIIFVASEGTMYNNFVLSRNITIPSGRLLKINSGQTLTIQSGYTLTNNGTIFKDNGGNIIGEERITGNKPISPSLTISGGTAYTYVGGILSINGNGTYTIGMRNGVTSTTADRIVVSSGVTANITLSNVNIDMSSISNACAFDMTGATVNLTLVGTNNLKSGQYRAGLQVPEGASLVITNSSTGSITALGGSFGAGIGGSDGFKLNNGGNITVNGGTVTATGGSYAAGIGGGVDSSIIGYYFCGSGGTFIINGGVVTATGGYSSPGIGGAAIYLSASSWIIGTNGIITRNGGTLNNYNGYY